MKHRSTMVDVARHAGVSIATVSRVMSKPEIVRPATRELVLGAIDALSFRPDATARALVSGRTHTVACVIPTLDHSIFARFTQSLHTAFADCGYHLLIAISNYETDTELRMVRAFQQRGVDALILVGIDHDHDLWREVKSWGKPSFLTWSCDPRLPSIGFDNFALAAQLTGHLLTLGHRRIAVVSGFTGQNDRARTRLEGVRATLQNHGLNLPKHLLLELPYTDILNGGRRALRQLMECSTPPSAILCLMDLFAAGVLLEAQRLKIDVPGKLSVCGIDDHELAQSINPGLTTIRLPVLELGKMTAQRILSAIEKQDIPQRTLMPFELIVRGSTGAAPALIQPAQAQRRAASKPGP